jgi:hypothetical protein
MAPRARKGARLWPPALQQIAPRNALAVDLDELR